MSIEVRITSLVFGKDHANGKEVMSVIDSLKELDQDEAINDIGIDDLGANASYTHTRTSTPNKMECSSQSYREKKKQRMMTRL